MLDFSHVTDDLFQPLFFGLNGKTASLYCIRLQTVCQNLWKGWCSCCHACSSNVGALGHTFDGLNAIWHVSLRQPNCARSIIEHLDLLVTCTNFLQSWVCPGEMCYELQSGGCFQTVKGGRLRNQQSLGSCQPILLVYCLLLIVLLCRLILEPDCDSVYFLGFDFWDARWTRNRSNSICLEHSDYWSENLLQNMSWRYYFIATASINKHKKIQETIE